MMCRPARCYSGLPYSCKHAGLLPRCHTCTTTLAYQLYTTRVEHYHSQDESALRMFDWSAMIVDEVCLISCS